ncbi:MAG: Spo0B domain-containing protein [Firmicutes bacterium]|nr:Spo0B domain-containing protein [Bacillota bacterium]
MKTIRRKFFWTQMIIIVTLSLLLGVAGTVMNLYSEMNKRDQNLQNAAEAVSYSMNLTGSELNREDISPETSDYLDTFKNVMDDIDVISVVNSEGVRVYHSNHSLIGTAYEGSWPYFGEENGNQYYAVNETGPSGPQRRAYAAVYTQEGQYAGFVMAIMLMEHIYTETYRTVMLYIGVTFAAAVVELLIMAWLFSRLNRSLMGYEPDTFTAMYKMRDNILEALEEGIVAADVDGNIQFTNLAADEMLKKNGQESEALRDILKIAQERSVRNYADKDILIDGIPVMEDGQVMGAVAILHDRAEYTQLMDDLVGTRHLVDSMRANNHDFTNKLHVILGLIQMEMYEEAEQYIQNITMVQRASISQIMNAVKEPAIAALLIGKCARAAELDVRFILREDSSYSSADMGLPPQVLVTILGNLLENALESMNEDPRYDSRKQLEVGLYSTPEMVLLTVEDTGKGISEDRLEHIFANGFSTKGDGRGTGLYQVKQLTESLGGTVTVESQPDVGTAFTICFKKTGGKHVPGTDSGR